MVNHYLAIVLVAFIDAGLLDALVELMKDPNNFLQVRATILLGEVIALANAYVAVLFYCASLMLLCV